ncbi:hypothetical protein F8M41_001935 [Gigaspora margarita]|uniref:Uncharacterized protein n=1 Tax=Gigaspora margarita TaxID=4874 RepID=A0A8H4AYX1_GIGMA|nr:hypothetical protein F8M41_001935 [Gigaspora margarita]
MIIDIDNHIISSGSHYRFQKWIEELSKPLPKGLLFLAFDNEQNRQKNYLDRGFNTVIYHIVTSFVTFNIAPQNKIQHNTDSPWLCNTLSKLQYEELFNISPQMQKIIDEELYTYLAEILTLLSEEKSSTNTIDSLLASIPVDISKMKFCSNCDLKNIKNRKRTCPRCKMQLPTLAKIQKEKIVEIENNIVDQLPNPLIFRPYKIGNEQSTTGFTQPITDQEVNIPEIYIPDPVNINSNSIANIEQVLLHIETISGIKNKVRKWIVVTCDGVPYRLATKLKEKFP